MAELSKTLIIGASGLVGSEIDFGIKTSRDEIDVTDVGSIIRALDRYNPEAVINLASVNIKDCHSNPFLANKINVIGAYNLAIETEKRGILLVQMSSGTVFNGEEKDTFDENSIPNPRNIYGQTKYIAERIVAKTNSRALIIRTGWLFGSRVKQNFFNRMLESAKAGKELRATYDQVGSFTYIKDFMDALKKLISENKHGIYNIVNSGKGNALDLAEILVSKLKSSSKIEKISVSESEKDGLMRSRSEVLISNKIKLRDWRSALEEYLKNRLVS